MRSRFPILAVVIFLLGLVVGQVTPSTSAQAAADPCAAPWDVAAGPTRPVTAGGQVEGGIYVVKFNRCTGEALVLAYDGPVLEQDDKNDRTSWRLYPTTGADQK